MQAVLTTEELISFQAFLQSFQNAPIPDLSFCGSAGKVKVAFLKQQEKQWLQQKFKELLEDYSLKMNSFEDQNDPVYQKFTHLFSVAQKLGISLHRGRLSDFQRRGILLE